MDKRTCAQQHFGPWAIDAKWMNNALSSIHAGTWKPKADMFDPEDDDPFDPEEPYDVCEGVAVICIEDQITKHESSYGGTSTVMTKKAIRMATNDPMVSSIVLKFDSPGGTVSGVSDLAYQINKSKKVKPVCAYIEDMCCSAAYWLAAQCTSISCNDTAIVGSIGVYTVLYDESGAYEAAGIKARLVTSGGVKGAGADGKVTQELVDDVQREIDALNEHFLTAVADGRKMNIEQVRLWNDGKVYIGQEAVDLGMVDAVESFDEALSKINNKGKTMNKESFMKYAAENVDADEVKAIRDVGLKAGKLAGKDEAVSGLKELIAAFPDRANFAIEQFVKGHDVQAAKAELADVLIEELKAAKAEPKIEAAVKVEDHQGSAAVPLAVPTVSAEQVEDTKEDKKPVATKNSEGAFVFRPNYAKFQ